MKRNILKMMTFCLLFTAMFMSTSKVEAASIITTKTEVHNLTNPGKVLTENDVMQVVVTLTPGSRDISKVTYSVNKENYSIDESTITFSGEMTGSGETSGEKYGFSFKNMTSGTEYTLTYNIRFTGTVTDEPIQIRPQQGSYNGNFTGGGIFGSGSVIVGGSNIIVYSSPEKNINKTATNTTTSDGKNRVGDTVEYEIELKNTSTTASLWDQINVSDYVPNEMLVDTSSIAVDGSIITNYTVDSNGDIIIPLSDLSNGNSTKITFNAKILDSAYGKTIINTAEVDGLLASDSGLYVEEKEVIKEPDKEKPPVKEPEKKPEEKPSTEVPPTTEVITPEKNNPASHDKTTTMNPSTANPSANANGSVNTMDTTNAGLLYVLLASAAVIIIYTKRKKTQE
ncbi:hypothetical protein [Breznakia pachnodae]|uniref:Repeat protein (TIGR01451 family) n=1 Tax=Breznakia pachnodae TaxID=265178 RepID=A0ABU0DZ32_9FIRM|nr:hypothetical protein [Breznakia pachnodae]MDQ0359831.1 putative repeat protein (TIGR01451 family) [Breznakia pachnodae]